MVEAINMWGPLVCSLHQLWMMHKIILPCKPLHAHFLVLFPLQSNPSVGKEPKNDWERGDCVLNQIIMSGYLLYRSLRWDSHNFDSRIPSAIHAQSLSVDADLIIFFILPHNPPPPNPPSGSFPTLFYFIPCAYGLSHLLKMLHLYVKQAMDVQC